MVDDHLIAKIHLALQHLELPGEKGEVTQIAKSPDKRHVAVGYSDGLVKVFDLHGGEVKVNFSGHKSAVTALSYDHQGLRLVSGAKVKIRELGVINFFFTGQFNYQLCRIFSITLVQSL